jgi:hypothetical protein
VHAVVQVMMTTMMLPMMMMMTMMPCMLSCRCEVRAVVVPPSHCRHGSLRCGSRGASGLCKREIPETSHHAPRHALRHCVAPCIAPRVLVLSAVCCLGVRRPKHGTSVGHV